MVLTPKVSKNPTAAYRSGDYSMKVIVEYFGVHYATVSWAVAGYEREREE